MLQWHLENLGRVLRLAGHHRVAVEGGSPQPRAVRKTDPEELKLPVADVVDSLGSKGSVRSDDCHQVGKLDARLRRFGRAQGLGLEGQGPVAAG